MSHAIPLGRSVEVSVPATTANLGPGFDTLGMALTMGDRLSATVVDGTGITVEGSVKPLGTSTIKAIIPIIKSGAVSPSACANPIIAPVKIPGIARGNT